MDKEDSCRDKKDSVKSSLPLHHIVAKPQSCIGEQCAPALCRGFFMYTGVHECTRHFRHKNAPNCENSGRFVYIFVYAFRKPLTLNVYCGERGTYTVVIPEETFYDLDGNLFNPELTYTFIVDNSTNIGGVEVEDANAVVEVYSVDGCLVSKGKKADVMKKLVKGIYIINGQKVVIR